MKSPTPRWKPGVSMLEVLIALGIAVAVTAVVVPWSFGWLGGRELDNAEDRLAMHLMMARAAAREEGKPVEVVAGVGGVEARWLGEEVGADDAIERGEPLFRESPDSARGFSASINAEWAIFELPDGVAIDLASDGATPISEGDAVSALETVESKASVGALGTTGTVPQTLAIFLPDGTVIMAPVFLLRTDAGAVRRMRIDGTTGRPKQVGPAPAPVDGFDRPEFDAEPPAGRR